MKKLTSNEEFTYNYDGSTKLNLSEVGVIVADEVAKRVMELFGNIVKVEDYLLSDVLSKVKDIPETPIAEVDETLSAPVEAPVESEVSPVEPEVIPEVTEEAPVEAPKRRGPKPKK